MLCQDIPKTNTRDLQLLLRSVHVFLVWGADRTRQKIEKQHTGPELCGIVTSEILRHSRKERISFLFSVDDIPDDDPGQSPMIPGAGFVVVRVPNDRYVLSFDTAAFGRYPWVVLNHISPQLDNRSPCFAARLRVNVCVHGKGG